MEALFNPVPAVKPPRASPSMVRLSESCLPASMMARPISCPGLRVAPRVGVVAVVLGARVAEAGEGVEARNAVNRRPVKTRAGRTEGAVQRRGRPLGGPSCY